MKYTRQASLADMDYLSRRLRLADLREIAALSDDTPQEALRKSLVHSSHAVVMVPEGKPVGVYGVCPTPNPEVGLIWMMASSDLLAHTMKFLKNSKDAINELFRVSGCSILTNFTDCRNELHHSWLRWCGAKFLRMVPIGIHGEYFYEFVITKEY